MLNFHSLNLYLIIATGAILPIYVDEILFPFHTVYAAIYFAFLLRFSANRAAFFRGMCLLLPITLVMMVGVFRANDIPYALEKIEGGVLASLLAAVVAAHCLQRYGMKEFLASYTNVTLAILAATMIYRVALGYEIGSRDGRFLINGPITYGWLMGIAATIGLFLYHHTRRKKYLIYVGIFSFMIFITGSKGPAVAFFAASAVFLIYTLKTKKVWVLALSAVLAITVSGQVLTIEALGRFAALGRILRGELGEGDFGSIGIRLIAWADSLAIFESHIFWGVGLGNWADYSSTELRYPHNFFFEIASEMGLFGLAAFALLILVLLQSRVFFVFLYLVFFLVALSFSGNMSYYRYLLGIPLGFFLEKESRIRRGIAK